MLIGPLGTNFSEILTEILKFSFKKMRLKVSSAKRRPFCPGLNVLSFPLAILYLTKWDTSKEKKSLFTLICIPLKAKKNLIIWKKNKILQLNKYL